MMDDDIQLVRQYSSDHSEEAFEKLVARYAGLVHSAAVRQVGSPHLAEEITQTVFIILARKAGSLSPKTVLPGWLYRTTRYVSYAALKIQRRREHREQEACMQATIQQTPDGPDWTELSPLLDEAMARLRDSDRDAILLRYFQNKSLRDVGAALGIDEYAAQKRVMRAAEKLRLYFVKHGIVSTTGTMAALISAHSVQTMPAALAKSISTCALAKGTAATGGSSLTLLKGALKIMAWTKAKTAMLVGAAALLAVGTSTAIVVHHERMGRDIFTRRYELTASDDTKYLNETGAAPGMVASKFLEACAQEDWDTVATFWETDPRNKDSKPVIPDSMKDKCRGMKIVHIGKPFSGRISIARLVELQPNLRGQFRGNLNGDFQGPQVFVPYEIKLKDGSSIKWQLSLRCDNPEHRWYFDGGF